MEEGVVKLSNGRPSSTARHAVHGTSLVPSLIDNGYVKQRQDCKAAPDPGSGGHSVPNCILLGHLNALYIYYKNLFLQVF